MDTSAGFLGIFVTAIVFTIEEFFFVLVPVFSTKITPLALLAKSKILALPN